MPAHMLDLKSLLPYFVLIGTLTAFLAHNKRGRKPLPWFFLGFFFGCLAILALFLLPKRLSTDLMQPALSHPISNTPSFIPVVETFPMTQELWYFLTEEQEQVGPISFQGLKKSYIEGRATKSSYVWNAQLEQWKKLEELPDYLLLIEERST